MIMFHSKKNQLMLLLFSFIILEASANYRTVYLEDSCRTNETFRLFIGSSNEDSAAIFKESRNSTLLPNRNCTVFILPPLGLGIVLSVRYLNMNPYEEPECGNYVLITDAEGPKKNIYLCGHSDDPTEFQTYYNTGPLNIFFHTGNFAHARSNFTFIVTAFETPLFGCPLGWFRCANGRCIWRGLTCDGHNNCGDQSDESPFHPSYCSGFGSFPIGVAIGIAIGTILFFALFVVLPIVYCYRRSKRRTLMDEERRIIVQDSPKYESLPGNIQHRHESGTASHHAPNTGTGLINDNLSPARTYQDPPPEYKLQ